ncbi:MAG: hypothetical protein PHU06_06805 [Gallionella sp.]|nr:hypothetical protein [Gallionella sp.]MDD4958031.1 hypothetical protein [Gallionella sp.]
MMQNLKVSREVINLCQNHAIGSKIDRVYLLDDYTDEIAKHGINSASGWKRYSRRHSDVYRK